MNTPLRSLIAAALLATAPAAAEPPAPLPAKANATEDAKSAPALSIRADAAELQWGPCPAFLPQGCRIAVLHGDPAQPNADVFFQVPGGAAIASHRHTSPERMVLVEGRLRVQYRGQPAATLEPGGYAYGPAGRSHEATCESTGPCTLFIAFEGPVDAIAD